MPKTSLISWAVSTELRLMTYTGGSRERAKPDRMPRRVWGFGESLPISYGVGERCELPSEVRGEAPATGRFKKYILHL